MKKNGMAFGVYVKARVYRGIVTGKNEVFVIDEKQKNELIKKDKKNAEIIKPYVEGKDVKAYVKIKPKHYLIFTRRGIAIDKYPIIKKYLENFKKLLIPKPKNWKPKNEEKWLGRKPGPYRWFEIQDSIDYYKEFEQDKIIYPNICKQPEFTYDKQKLYTNCKCFIIPTKDFFLLGVLNSELAHFWFEMFLPKLRGGFYEPNYIVFKNFPVCKVDLKEKEIAKEKDKIMQYAKILLDLSRKSKNKEVKTECLYYRNEINKLVYKIYGIKQSDREHILEILENVKR